jgi:hypothetical protein
MGLTVGLGDGAASGIMSIVSSPLQATAKSVSERAKTEKSDERVLGEFTEKASEGY